MRFCYTLCLFFFLPLYLFALNVPDPDWQLEDLARTGDTMGVFRYFIQNLEGAEMERNIWNYEFKFPIDVWPKDQLMPNQIKSLLEVEPHFSHARFLHEAVLYDDVKVARTLLKNNTDVNIPDEFGRRPYFYANSADMAFLLFSEGKASLMDDNLAMKKDHRGMTALHYIIARLTPLLIESARTANDEECTIKQIEKTIFALIRFNITENCINDIGLMTTIKDREGRFPADYIGNFPWSEDIIARLQPTWPKDSPYSNDIR